MSKIDDILAAIDTSVAKINEAHPGLAQAQRDSGETSQGLAQLGTETPANQLSTSAIKLSEAAGHLAAAVSAANEAAASARAARGDSTGLLAPSSGPTPSSATVAEPSTSYSTAGVSSHPASAGHATFGHSSSSNYRKTFFNRHPETEGKVVVHHAVEQQTQKLYPGVVPDSQLHSYENLRGIPKGEVNNRVHLSAIRKSWNEFYEDHPNPTKQQLLDHATMLDNKYGAQFNPPIR